MTTGIADTTAYTSQHNTMSPVNPNTIETSHDNCTTEYGLWGNTEPMMTAENSGNLDTPEDNRHQTFSGCSKRKQTVAVMPQDQDNHNFVTLNRQDQHPVIPTIPYITYAATSIPPAISPMQATIVTIASPLSPNNNNPSAAPSFPALYSPSMQRVILSNNNLLNSNFADPLEPMSKRSKISPVPFSNDPTSTESPSPQSSVDPIDFSQPISCNYATDFEHSMDLELSARLAVEEDKRRRNTAASARFRIKKKIREQTLEQTVKDMTTKAEMLEGRVKEMELEIKWLRSLIIEKDPRLLDVERPSTNEKKGQEAAANATSSPPPSPLTSPATYEKTTNVTSSSSPLPSPAASSASPITIDDEESEKSPREDPVEPNTAQE